MTIGGQPGNDNAKNESDKMSSSFKSRRETKDGTAGRIGKQYGVNGRTIRPGSETAGGGEGERELLGRRRR